MTIYALVNPDNQIVQVKANIDPNVQTKAGWRWVPTEDDVTPSFVRGIETATSERVVLDGKAVLQWTVQRRDLASQKEAVKEEAQRRIIALTGKTTLQDCMIKQFNALMRAGELTDKRASGETLTPQEEGEVTVLRSMAARVKAIRAASDALEAMDPIPLDYTSDGYWQ